MATKEYIAKYRQLKQIYERELNKQIADITWYRVVATLKQHFSGSNAILLDEPKQSAIANLITQYKNRLTTYQLVLILKSAEYL